MIEDIRYLIVFAKVAELGSLARAADEMDLSPATISAHLSKLEKNLGAALLYRNTRKVSLTADGTKLLETAQAMLGLYEKGVIDFKRRAVSTGTSLSISIPATLINHPGFMGAIAAFTKDAPDLQLVMQCSDHRSDVIGEGIDVAFRIGDLPDSSLKAKPLFAIERLVVAHPSLLQAHPRVSHPRDLAGLPWIGLAMRPDHRAFHDKRGNRFDIRYTPRVRVDSVEAAYRLCMQGLGLAAPPVFLARDDIMRGRIWEVLPGWTLEPLAVHAVWPPNMSRNSVAYQLINTICDSFPGIQKR